jgi:hypothetical protein
LNAEEVPKYDVRLRRQCCQKFNNTPMRRLKKVTVEYWVLKMNEERIPVIHRNLPHTNLV